MNWTTEMYNILYITKSYPLTICVIEILKKQKPVTTAMAVKD